jgi:hypothetical protein
MDKSTPRWSCQSPNKYSLLRRKHEHITTVTQPYFLASADKALIRNWNTSEVSPSSFTNAATHPIKCAPCFGIFLLGGGPCRRNQQHILLHVPAAGCRSHFVFFFSPPLFSTSPLHRSSTITRQSWRQWPSSPPLSPSRAASSKPPPPSLTSPSNSTTHPKT